jgi:cytochrome c oxidase cbb3-type subunit III
MKKPDEFSGEHRLLDHNYDGIQEADYPLPRWWLMIFYATIVFGIGYAGYYLTGVGPDGRAELATAMRAIVAKRPPDNLKSSDTEKSLLFVALKDQKRIASGRAVFQGKCVACHGANAEGGIGPNLTDDYWIHGKGGPEDIFQTIRTGVASKGMPPWADVLKEDELVCVTAFIRSVRGTNPAGAKSAQGGMQEFKEL